jgi:hypothetical protein
VRIIGAAEGTIMATIMTDHMTNTRLRLAALQPPVWGMATPEPRL